MMFLFFFFFQAEDGIRYGHVTGVQTCALPILKNSLKAIFNRTLGVLNPSTNLRSSLVGRSERSAFQNCIPLTAPIEFFNRIGREHPFESACCLMIARATS